MHLLLRVAFVALFFAAPVSASAQSTYPDRTIRFIVSASAGGGTDIIARLVAQQLNALWNVPVIVENRTGASGNLSAQHVARSAPDGTTLFVTFGGVLTINPHLFKELGYDPDKDFIPITSLASAPYLLTVNPDAVPSRTVKDFIAYAKAKQPEKLNWASTNKGSPDHLSGELFSMMAGVPMNYIPYRGASDALLDVLGGRVPLGYFSIPASLSHVRAGKLVPLGLSDRARSPLLPDVPTIAEAALPGYEVLTWFAAWAPAGTPQPVIDKIYSGISTVLQNAGVRQKLVDGGYTPGGEPPAEFAKFVKVETEKYGRIIRTIGLEKN
jgi:tripartite-type tricarboxylate transporter receptor subunit TctC